MFWGLPRVRVVLRHALDLVGVEAGADDSLRQETTCRDAQKVLHDKLADRLLDVEERYHRKCGAANRR